MQVAPAEIVADQFGLPIERVTVMPTSTEKNNNTSPTAASASTDLNGAAAIVACNRIKARMASLASRHDLLPAQPEQICFEDGHLSVQGNPSRKIAFRELADRARRERVDLGARGYFATPELDFDPETGLGTPSTSIVSDSSTASTNVGDELHKLKQRRQP